MVIHKAVQKPSLLLILIALTVVCVTLSGCLPGKSYGSVTGIIRDAVTLDPIPGATVTLLNTGILTTTTGVDGSYRFHSAPVGTYTMKITNAGYVDRLESDVIVVKGRTTEVSAKMIGQQSPKVLLYDDSPLGNSFVREALTFLGIPFTEVNNPTDLMVQMESDSWHLIVADNADYAEIPMLDGLSSYLDAGGHLAFSTFMPAIALTDQIPSLATHSIWGKLGADFSRMVIDDIHASSPFTVYAWAADHPIFRSPNNVPPIHVDKVDYYIIEGVMGYSGVEGQAIAGVTSDYQDGQGMIFVANSKRAVLNSFLPDAARNDGNPADISDEDADGVSDAVEMWQNEVMYLLSWTDAEAVQTPAAGVGACSAGVIRNSN